MTTVSDHTAERESTSVARRTDSFRPRFEVGEVVDVAAKGVRVAAYEPDQKLIKVELAADTHGYWLPLAPSVTVTRRAPAEWPPQPGDIWKDTSGAEWFATARHGGVWMVTDGDADSADNLLHDGGPLALVRRKGWTPAPADDVDQADEDEPRGRAAIIAGLRDLADFLEATPDLPINEYSIDARLYVRHMGLDSDEARHDELERLAALMGVQTQGTRTEKPYPSAVHRSAIKKFSGGITFEVHYTDAWPAPAVETDPDALDQLAVAATDPGELAADEDITAWLARRGPISERASLCHWCTTGLDLSSCACDPACEWDGCGAHLRAIKRDLVAAPDDATSGLSS